MQRASFLALAFIAMCLRPALRAGDWPQFRGPEANGFAHAEGLNWDWRNKPPKVAWTRPMRDGGYAGPSLAKGKLYIVDHEKEDDVVLCLEAATGKELWRFTYPDKERSNYGFARATPAVDENRVYVLGRQGFLACLETAKGEAVWRKDLVQDLGGEKPKWGYCASPLVDGEKLIVETGGKNLLVALDKKTGQTLWSGGGADKASFATPVVAELGGKKKYLVFSGNMLCGVKAEDGERLWSVPWETKYPNHIASPVMVPPDGVFFVSGYGRGCALAKIEDGQAKLAWENKEIISRIQSPIFHAGRLYCTGEQGALVCLEAATGKLLWKQPGFGWGGLIAAGDKLLVMDDKAGKVSLAKLGADKFEELANLQPPLGKKGKIWTCPILGEGFLVVRSLDVLAVIDLRP